MFSKFMNTHFRVQESARMNKLHIHWNIIQVVFETWSETWISNMLWIRR